MRKPTPRIDINKVFITGYVSVPPCVREDMILDFRVTDYKSIRKERVRSSFWFYVPAKFDPEKLRYDRLTTKIMRQCKKGAKVILFGYFSPFNKRRKDGTISKVATAGIRVTDCEMADAYIYMNAFDPYKIAEAESKLEKRRKLLERKGDPLEQTGIAFDDEIEEFNNDPEIL
jgi:hypothetical protein